jgi:hypothetical protein
MTKEDFEPAYWNKLWKWYAEDGYGHVATHLAALDLSKFDPKAPPPQTPLVAAAVRAVSSVCAKWQKC